MSDNMTRKLIDLESQVAKLQEEREILRQVGERMMKFADIFKDENAKLKEELEIVKARNGHLNIIVEEAIELKSILDTIKKLINKKISNTVADCICKQYSGKGKCKEHDGYNNTSGEVEFLKELESLAKDEETKND